MALVDLPVEDLFPESGEVLEVPHDGVEPLLVAWCESGGQSPEPDEHVDGVGLLEAVPVVVRYVSSQVCVESRGVPRASWGNRLEAKGLLVGYL